jgi:PGF-pre-PGF domain-containing protein
MAGVTLTSNGVTYNTLDEALAYATAGDLLTITGNGVNSTTAAGNATTGFDQWYQSQATDHTNGTFVSLTSNGKPIFLNNTLSFSGNETHPCIVFTDAPYFYFDDGNVTYQATRFANTSLIQFVGNGTRVYSTGATITIYAGSYTGYAMNFISNNNTIVSTAGNAIIGSITGNPKIAINITGPYNNIPLNTTGTINATSAGVNVLGTDNKIWINSPYISASDTKVHLQPQAHHNTIWDLGYTPPLIYIYNGTATRNASAWYFFNNSWSDSQNTLPRIRVWANGQGGITGGIPFKGNNVTLSAKFANLTVAGGLDNSCNVVSNSTPITKAGYTEGIIINDTSVSTGANGNLFHGMTSFIPVNVTYGPNWFNGMWGRHQTNEGYSLDSFVVILNFDPILSLPEGNNFNHTQMTNWTTIADYTAAPNLTFAVDNGAAAPLMLGMLKFNNNLDLTNQTVGTALSLIGDNFRTAADGGLINFTMINAAMLATFNNQASVTVYPTAFTFNSGNDLQIVGSTDAGAGTTLYSNGAWVNRGGYVGPTDDITIVTDASARKNITLPVLHFSTYAFSKYSAPSPNSPGGGGDTSGAGPSAPAAPAAPAAPGESVTASVNVGGGTAVTKADITGTGLSKAVVTSNPVSALPSSVSPASTTVYQYLDITQAGATTINQAALGFAVSKSWLAEKGYGKQDIAMLHNVGSTWQSLPTVITGEDANNVYYSSTTTTFSYFAIGYQKGAANVTVTATPTATAVATTALPQTTTPVSTTKAPVATATTVAPAPAASPAGGLPLTTIAIGVIAVIIVAVAAFFVRRWWIRKQNPALFKEL